MLSGDVIIPSGILASIKAELGNGLLFPLSLVLSFALISS